MIFQSSLGWKSEVQRLNKLEYFTFTFIFLGCLWGFFKIFYFFSFFPSPLLLFLVLEKAPGFFLQLCPGGFSAGFYTCVPGGRDADPAAFELGWDPPRSLRELSASSCNLRAKRFSVPGYLKSSGKKSWELRGRERALPGGRSCGVAANTPGSSCSEAEL